jgi:hypothetical protein
MFNHPQLVHVFLHLNNSLDNKWFDFKIPFQNIYTIIPFPTCFVMGYLKPIHTLSDVVIVNSTQVDLLPQSCTTQRFVTSNATQVKERSYRNQHPINQFLPLAIKVFDYLHKHVDMFLLDYANAIWSLKGSDGFHLSTLITFLCQKVSITLQRMQASCILSQVIIVVDLTTSQLPPLQDTPPITTANLLQTISL